MTLDKFLRDLWPKQMFRRTDRQTLKCRMATITTAGNQENKIFPAKKNIKIGTLVQKLWLNLLNVYT